MCHYLLRLFFPFILHTDAETLPFHFLRHNMQRGRVQVRLSNLSSEVSGSVLSSGRSSTVVHHHMRLWWCHRWSVPPNCSSLCLFWTTLPCDNAGWMLSAEWLCCNLMFKLKEAEHKLKAKKKIKMWNKHKPVEMKNYYDSLIGLMNSPSSELNNNKI